MSHAISYSRVLEFMTEAQLSGLTVRFSKTDGVWEASAQTLSESSPAPVVMTFSTDVFIQILRENGLKVDLTLE